MEDGKVKRIVCATAEETQRAIKRASNISELKKLEVLVDMSHLYPHDMEDMFNLVFVDTPGTDSNEGNDLSKKEQEQTHLALTKKILSSEDKEMVVLVSDKRIESKGITDILDIFESQAGEDRNCYNDRFLFVLNQCDTFSYIKKNGDSLENEVLKLKENLARPYEGQQRNIANPRVFPLAAAPALAIRIACEDPAKEPEAGTEEADYYQKYDAFCKKLTGHHAEYYMHSPFAREGEQENYKLDRLSDIPKTAKARLCKAYDNPDQSPDMRNYMLLHSGLPSLETAITTYIEKYAFPLKIRKTFDAFQSILTELDEECNSYTKALEEAEQKVKQETDKKEKEIEERRKEKKTEGRYGERPEKYGGHEKSD